MSELLEEYIDLTETSEDISPWVKVLNEMTSDNALALAYLGAAYALQAKEALNPLSKLSLARKACRQLDLAVEQMPDHPEPRYLRYSIKRRIPSFLGLSNDIDEDKAFLLTWLSEEEDHGRMLKNLVLAELGESELAHE